MQTKYFGTRSRYDNGIFVVRKLSNGIQVHLQRPQLVPDDNGIVMAFLPNVGSCIEAPHEHGIAHFFEHIPFDERQLSGMHRAGGDWNGSTSILLTSFHITAPRESFAQSVRALKLLVAEPSFEEQVVLRERGVISREYAMKWADTEYDMAVRKCHAFFGKDHPLGHFPIGDLQVIEMMTAEMLEHFFVRHYHAGNIQLVCGGAFSELGEERVLNLLEQVFGTIRRGMPTSLEVRLPLQKRSEQVVLTDADFPREHLALHCLSGEQLTPVDIDALDFLAGLMSGMHSPLLRELRTKRGWVYESGLCHMNASSFGWDFGLECWTKHEHFAQVRDIFWKVLKELSPKYIQEQQNLRQLERKSEFSHPVNLCKQVPNRIASIMGSNHSWHFWEGLEDELSLERVFKWRDRLLRMDPIVFELRQK